jgi:hypothetical protein
MNAREESARKNGLVKVFLLPQEVALMVACLEWVSLDLKIADMELKKLDKPVTKPIKSRIPDRVFAAPVPVVTSTMKTLIVHSVAHYEETDDTDGKNRLQEETDKWCKRFGAIRDCRDLVALGTHLQTLPEDKK